MPPISGQDALKALNRKGFRIRKGKGSHVVVDRLEDHIQPFVVPLKKELKKGTQNFIVKSSKNFKDHFLKLAS